MSILRRIRKAIRARQVELSDHALEEMDDDNLTLVDIRTVLSHGKLRERAEDDPRGNRYVLRGMLDDAEVDVACRFTTEGILWVITVYVVGESEYED